LGLVLYNPYNKYCSLSNPQSINQLDKFVLLKIYPNPNNGSFKIQIDTEIKNGQVVLINAIGQKVFEQKIERGTNEIDTNDLKQGLYTYILLDNNVQISNGKLVFE